MLRFFWSIPPPERQRLLVAMTILACAVFLLDRYGNVAELYHTDYFGYDKFVHFMAGAFWGVFGLWLFQPSGATKELRYALMAAFVVSFWVGISWEIYEIIFNEPDMDTVLYWGDTATDVLYDVLGGVCAGFLFREKSRSALS